MKEDLHTSLCDHLELGFPRDDGPATRCARMWLTTRAGPYLSRQHLWKNTALNEGTQSLAHGRFVGGYYGVKRLLQFAHRPDEHRTRVYVRPLLDFGQGSACW